MTLHQDPQIQSITEKIVQNIRPKKIILFGSRAWGGITPDSDVDLLIITESSKPRRERQMEIDSLLYPRSTPLDILVYTPAELSRQINEYRNLFLEDIVRNGVVLYAKD